jgi:hypothetical protein
VGDGALLAGEERGEGFALGGAVAGAALFAGEEVVGCFLREGGVEIVVA